MKEQVFNLFLFVNDGLIRELGISIHEVNGSDATKLKHLQRNVNGDFPRARRFAVPRRYAAATGNGVIEAGVLTHNLFNEMALVGRQVAVFEEMFTAVGAPRDPLTCITPVVDGVIPKIDAFLKTSHS